MTLPCIHRSRWYRSAAVAVCLATCAIVAGCSRWHYVERADQDAYGILDLHGGIDPQSAPTDLTVEPVPQSRLFDPTPVETPLLPHPVPRLHTYAIPSGVGGHPTAGEELPPPPPQPLATVHVSLDSPDVVPGGHASRAFSADRGTVRFLLARLGKQQVEDREVTPLAIPRSVWESIPAECRKWMFEFDSVQREYFQTYGGQPPLPERDSAPRLSFDDILYLSLLNSREYQTQKEQLYRVALRLSLQEYDYQLKFAPFGNRSGARYETRGSSLGSFSRLDVPTSVQAQALLGTGTNLVTRFANSVLMTFNGPDGFAADIGSEMLFELTHSVYQNDVRFERLTQAERNVVYAARDFARFRRTFYLQLANQYYSLLRTYRQVEIDSQNYLSLVRVFRQREVEFEQGEVARVQIDQVEQNALSGRSNLIGTCNNLENALDELKLRMGLPTEMPLNLDLSELESLTVSDEALVKLELVRRVQGRLTTEWSRGEPDEAVALNYAAELAARMREAIELRRPLPSRRGRSATAPPAPEDAAATDESLRRLTMLQAWLLASELRLLSDGAWEQLQQSRQDPNAPAIRTPQLTLEFAQSILNLLAEERRLAEVLAAPPEQAANLEQNRLRLRQEVEAFEALYSETVNNVQRQQLDQLRRQAETLAESAAQTARAARGINRARAEEVGLNVEDSPRTAISRLLEQSRQLLAESPAELPPIDLDMDAASLAALLGRLDLANARGTLFDEWRGTKLAADDLRSVLDLQARQRLITQNQNNLPLEVDFDESRTELSVTLDTPLNRRLQRNVFREQLLNYQFSRRSVMRLEDLIKQDVRSGLRSVRLSREQHMLGIASAALAYERVASTELQLRLGVAGVVARDYLEAQTAYANSLSLVSSRHISYILGRIALATDLEQLQLDPYNRWPALHDPTWTPALGGEPYHPPAYGDLPWGLHYSQDLTEQMQHFWTVDGATADNSH